MNNESSTITAIQRTRAAAFRALHTPSDMLVLPGVWNVASARIFATEGFPALGTTSSGMAWSMGFACGQDLTWPAFLDACRSIARSVDVPVSFDVEAGFGDTAATVCSRVRQTIEAGACGINLEDGMVDGRLHPPDLLIDALRAIREACADLDYPLFVNARTDVYLGGLTNASEQLAETIRRGRRYAEAGADGFFVPGLVEPAAIASVVREVPLPLNVYALPGLPNTDRLRAMGVRRVSVGCGPLQALLSQARAVARALRDDGDWTSFTHDWLTPDEAVTLCTGIDASIHPETP